MWIEITQEDHEHGGNGWEYGTCLWSPTTNKIGHKIYELMREPQEGDRVLHFYSIKGKRYFHGTSIVMQRCKKTTIRPEIPGDWGWANEFYRIELGQFRKNQYPIEIRNLTKTFDAVLREEIINDVPKSYPFVIYPLSNQGSDVRLSQGKYLTRCTQKLFTLLDECSHLDFQFENQSPAKSANLQEFSEGKRRERETYFFSRNQALVREAKQTYGYICQACGFDFQEKYGLLGDKYIECHHENVLSERPSKEWHEDIKTNIANVKVLCANCHRMIHRKRPALSFEELLEVLRKQSIFN